MSANFKKIIAVVLSAALALSFTACGGSDNTGDSDEAVISEESTASARVTVEGTKFMVDGKELWINGTNTPWEKWNDFSGQMDEAYWDETFAQLAADNINCTRIWVNCNGESIVRLKTTGEVKEINEAHWTDLDKLFAIAEKYGVYIMATLTSFDHFKEPNGGYKKWRELIKSQELTDTFADTYVKEFCQRYGENEYLFSIDIMNEPDWVYENDECGKGEISWENLSYFFGKCASVIHQNCDTLVTVGMGMIKYNSDNYQGNMVSDEYLKELTGLDDAYLDFYSPHYYAWMLGTYLLPFNITPEEFGLGTDKPCIIGETPNDDDDKTGMSAADKYSFAYGKGWNGVMTWMDPVLGDDGTYTWYKYDLTAEATNAIAETAYDKVYPIGKKTAE
ncbi:MAG: cellulase family glycosylhydrolase [Oscillospiraceae bacterium]|nr:cellulase family glycosylhydrolase [Oscillospiraceae bacterium]